jgi:hypothetical protein
MFTFGISKSLSPLDGPETAAVNFDIVGGRKENPP